MENHLFTILRRRRRNSGILVGHAISRHQKNLDLVLCAGRGRLQRPAARSVLLDRGREEMPDLVSAVCMDRNESHHALPYQQFSGRTRLRETGAAARRWTGEKNFGRPCRRRIRRSRHLGGWRRAVRLVRALSLPQKNLFAILTERR